LRIGDLYSRWADVFKNLEAVVIAVRNVDFVVPADSDSVGQPEFPGASAGFTEIEQQTARIIENLDVVEERINNVNMTERIGGNAFGPTEVAGAVTRAAELAFELAVGIDDLNALIDRIGHQEIAAAIRRDMRREVELALSDAATSKLGLKMPLAIEHNHAMALGVGYKELVLEQRETGGSREVIRGFKNQFPGFIESDDPAQAGIGDVENFFAVNRGHRRDKMPRANFIPALEFLFCPVVKANGISASVSQAKVVILVQGEAERFHEGFVALLGAGQPMAESFEGGEFYADIGGTLDTLDIGDPGGIGWLGPDQLFGGSRRRGGGMLAGTTDEG
jgi:hypothetical protein